MRAGSPRINNCSLRGPGRTLLSCEEDDEMFMAAWIDRSGFGSAGPAVLEGVPDTSRCGGLCRMCATYVAQ